MSDIETDPDEPTPDEPDPDNPDNDESGDVVPPDFDPEAE